MEKLKDGNVKRNYIPRTEEELKKFEDIVKSAMGYSEDREDRISVTSIPFSESISSENQMVTEADGFDFMAFLKDYRKTIINLFLLVAVFFVLVRPLLKGLKNMPRETGSGFTELPGNMLAKAQLPAASRQDKREKILEIGRTNPESAEQLIKGWISE